MVLILALMGGPGVVFEPSSGALAAGKGEGFVSSNASTEVNKELEGVGERLGEFLEVAFPTCEDKDVVGKNSGTHVGGACFEDPRPSEEGEDHHAEGASLGDALGMVVGLADVTSKTVVDN